MGNSTVHVLLVEDDDIDAEAMERAFRKQKIANPIVRARDGIEALQILRGDGIEPLSRPYIIFLDLNMPRMNGNEFLREIRNDKSLSDCVVFVLTTSNADCDKVAAYKEHVAGYIVKAKAGDDFSKLVNLIDGYWRIVELPANAPKTPMVVEANYEETASSYTLS